LPILLIIKAIERCVLTGEIGLVSNSSKVNATDKDLADIPGLSHHWTGGN